MGLDKVCNTPFTMNQVNYAQVAMSFRGSDWCIGNHFFLCPTVMNTCTRCHILLLNWVSFGYEKGMAFVEVHLTVTK